MHGAVKASRTPDAPGKLARLIRRAQPFLGYLILQGLIAGRGVWAAGAWWGLASVASSLMGDRRARLGVKVALLILGLCGPIASWNSTFLSESVAISLTAL